MGRQDHEPVQQPLGDLIRSYRGTAGLTQHELAAKAGLSLAAVRDLEQGRRSRPRNESLAALSSALGLDGGRARALERAARQEQSRLTGYLARSAPRSVRRVKSGLWISVLGPLEVWRDGKPLRVRSPARQAILGLLAVDPGMLVQREALLELVWGEQPPRTAVELLQAHVSRLRRVLWPANSNNEEPTIASTGGCYRLRVSPDELDRTVFDELAKAALSAKTNGDTAAACKLYGQAFEMYRGDPCGNISLLQDHPAVTEVRRQLAEALLQFAEVAGDLGRHDLVLQRLQALAVQEPLNERVHARLMIALAGCGQQAAALRLYEDLRLRLDAELGLYPGAELAETHLRLLRQDIRAGASQAFQAVNDPDDASYPVPRQLPAAARHFTGRHRELVSLSALLDSPVSAMGTTPVAALTGMAGVGKSALAVYWAHQVAHQFPDGQLFADLRGFSEAGNPAPVSEVIRAFLRALGVEDWRIPADMEGQFALYRSLLATRRVMIVLDNAEDAQQVRPLLPGAAGCFVLVTSRNRLTGLSASHGSHLLPLDCLTDEQARTLLARGLGDTRVRVETQAADEIITLCARLPLALCNTIAQAAAHPRRTLAELAAAMRQAQGRLDTMETGENATSVRTVFSWSRTRLSNRAERMFRLLAVHPGLDMTVASAASLTGTSTREAYLALAELSHGYLVTEHMPGRYSCHDLLRAYAGEVVRVYESEEERRLAVWRVLDYYLRTAGLAASYLVPCRLARVSGPALPGVVPEEFRSAAEAEEWVRAERSALLAAITLATEEEFTPHAWELAWTAGAFLRGTVCWELTVQSLERALVTAKRLGNIPAQTMIHQHLAWLRLKLGDPVQAHQHLDAVLAFGNRRLEVHDTALVHLLRARVLRAEGRGSEAQVEAQQALHLYRASDDSCGELRALTEIRWLQMRAGDRTGAEVSRGDRHEPSVRSRPA